MDAGRDTEEAGHRHGSSWAPRLSAVRQFEAMVAKGLEPDVITYNSVINAYAQSGDSASAVRQFEAMVAKGLEPDVITYSSVINVCARSKPADVHAAKAAVARLSEQGLTVNSYTLSAMLRCCAYARPRDSALAEIWFRSHVGLLHLNQHVCEALAKAVGAQRATELENWAKKSFPECVRPPQPRGYRRAPSKTGRGHAGGPGDTGHGHTSGRGGMGRGRAFGRGVTGHARGDDRGAPQRNNAPPRGYSVARGSATCPW
jgi:pentatricopeptide repeat protein